MSLHGCDFFAGIEQMNGPREQIAGLMREAVMFLEVGAIDLCVRTRHEASG